MAPSHVGLHVASEMERAGQVLGSAFTELLGWESEGQDCEAGESLNPPA